MQTSQMNLLKEQQILHGYIEDTYILSSDLDFPEFIDTAILDDVVVPEIPDFSSSLSLDDEHLFKLIADGEESLDMPRLSSIIQNRIDRIDSLSAKTDELQCLKNMKSYMKISFSPYEPYFKEWIKVDEVLIDGKKAAFNVKTENGKE